MGQPWGKRHAGHHVLGFGHCDVAEPPTVFVSLWILYISPLVQADVNVLLIWPADARSRHCMRSKQPTSCLESRGHCTTWSTAVPLPV